MTKDFYEKIEAFMLDCMKDSAHDKEHVYRVLHIALDIAAAEKDVDEDILIAACLLHDIGRKEQFEDPALCHAAVGSGKAYHFLLQNGYTEERAAHCRDCILTHRYRSGNTPASIEAEILFDADKVEAAGAFGIARTLIYNGLLGEPLYTVDAGGGVLDGSGTEPESFFSEYKYKLEGVYDIFYTRRAEQIARERQPHAVAFYEALLREAEESSSFGKKTLEAMGIKGRKGACTHGES